MRLFFYIQRHCTSRFSSATFLTDLPMPTKHKAATAKPKKPSQPKVENIMTNDASIPIPPSSPAPGRRARKASKGFVQTVKEDFRSAIKAVGKFVKKAGSNAPPVKKRKTKAPILPPFTPP